MTTKTSLRFHLPPGHLVTVKNDESGLQFIKSLREQVKLLKPTHLIKVYGRGHRYGKGRMKFATVDGRYTLIQRNTYQSHVPRHLAQYLAVYLQSK